MRLGTNERGRILKENAEKAGCYKVCGAGGEGGEWRGIGKGRVSWVSTTTLWVQGKERGEVSLELTGSGRAGAGN